MGDASFDIQQLSRESFRLETYDANTLSNVKNQLARAGFYYIRNGLRVKCFVCNYEFDATDVKPDTDIVSLHKENRPECKFAKKLEPVNGRSKKFLSYDSLRYEKERLETFIEWPITWLSPDDLAADGFYYLRTNDHCACVFCRGIVGAWEDGDTPRGEHQRHFPHCPFIRGQPVGNVPLTHSTILDRLPLDGEECPLPPPRCEYSIDEAGTTGQITTGGRHMPGSYPEYNGPNKKDKINYDEIGLRQYSGPKRKDYVTKESRLKSFSRWPERVVQKPEAMADAGFFYCGLSDHVRCFHCGSGLRNWETEDRPWEEHARWYPDCNYVLLSKGQAFIDNVRRERPPFVRSPAFKDNKPQKVVRSSGQFKPIAEKDLEPLMQSDIIQAVKGMGFPPTTIRKALRQKLEQTGMPFFSLEPCIEAVLKTMEEETRQTLHGPSDATIEEEAMARQSDKMQLLNIESQSRTSSGASTSGVSAGAAATPSSQEVIVSPSTTVASQSTAPVTVQQVASITTVTTPPPSPVASPSPVPSVVASANSPSTSSTQVTRETTTAPVTLPQEVSVSNPPTEAMDVDEESAEVREMQTLEGPPAETAGPFVEETNLPGDVVALQEADQRISAADQILKPSRSGPPALEGKAEEKEPLDGKPADSIKKLAFAAAQPSQKDIAEELERIRESRSCKVCMDAEMDVVFLPCTHMATCSSCAVAMAQCPICRHEIKYTIKPIFS